MNYEVLSIRYGEISLKGNNKRKFYDQLFRTVKSRLRAYPDLDFEKHFDHITIRLHGTPYEEVVDALRFVFGIQMIRAGVEVEKSLEAMMTGALEIVKGETGIRTFKISSRRKDKSFPHPSFEINDELGGYILSQIEEIQVDVHHPDLEIKVEVKHHHVNLFGKAIKGAGGMPVGTSGKVMLMLSGGIDSPVAGFQLLKRGAKIEGLHFHSPPYTSDRAKQKVIDLGRRLKEIGGDFKLHLVPFTNIQLAIRDKVHENYSMTVMRRVMLRIAERWAVERYALAIATGESLGQVASQTLDSMHTINEVTSFPVLRPLISEDKVDIMALAEKIGTYEISIRPYEDCCTIFLPKAPKTKPNREKTNYYEQALDLDSLIDEAISGIETLDLKANESLLDDLL